MNPQRRLLWFRRLALAGAILAAGVVVLGAWVRLTDAGLGCPDWPGCYGHIYPNAGQSAAQSGSHFAKALHEMIHRYFATTLGIIITSLLVWALRFRKDRGQPLIPVAVLFVRRVPARRTGRLDRDAAAQALDRDGASAGRPDHAWACCGGWRWRRRRARRPSAKRLCANLRWSAPPSWLHKLRSAVGPAPIMPPWPALTCPPASIPGGRRWIFGTPSCCGAVSDIDYEGRRAGESRTRRHSLYASPGRPADGSRS